mgnify:CR=1 FL=1
MSIPDRIRAFTETAQSLISELHRANPNDETFDQVGILDAKTIVTDYLDYGEPELALKHLLYIVHESNIDFPASDLNELHSIVKQLGVRNFYDTQ